MNSATVFGNLQKRVAAVRREIVRRKLDGLLIHDPVSSLYLSGFPCSNSLIYISRSESLFATDSRYITKAQTSITHLDVVLMNRDASAEAPKLAARLGTRQLGFEEQESVRFFRTLQSGMPNVEFHEAGDILRNLRMVKSPEEVAQIRANQKLTESVYKQAISDYKSTMTETVIKKIICLDMVSRGVEEAFSTIVATGPNTALPHAVPSSRRGRPGEFLLIDMGIKANFYHSDMTRTVAIGDKQKLDSQSREIYEIVRQAQELAISKIKHGAKCAEVDRAARSYIAEAGYGDAFGHGLGHGVGLEIHEGPTLSPRSTEVLKEGMVVSVEPGIYLPGKAGVRIEDLVVVTRDGCENLNRLPKSFKFIA